LNSPLAEAAPVQASLSARGEHQVQATYPARARRVFEAHEGAELHRAARPSSGISLLPAGELVAHTEPMFTSTVTRGVTSMQAPNPSIERTALSQLRWPKSAAHVER
jgi:hypothetical protein